MNYIDQTQKVFTFADVPRIEIGKHSITGLDDWDADDRITVQLSTDQRAIADAVVDFLASLHGSPYLSAEDIELLQRFAGAMGLDYNNVPGIANYVRNPEG